MWSELGGAARDVVDVVRGRRGRSSAKPLGTWSTWLLDQFDGQRVVGVAEEDAGVAGARSNVVGAVADAGEVVVDADWICAYSVVMAMKLSEPVVQVTWPMVNVRPFGVAMEPKMMTILFVWGAVRTPPYLAHHYR